MDGSGLEMPRTNPWVLVTIEGVLEGVLDLTDSAVRSELGTDREELSADWHHAQSRYQKNPPPPTQMLGLAAFASRRILCLKYDSTKNRGEGHVVAVFSEHLSHFPNSSLKIYDQHGFLRQNLP